MASIAGPYLDQVGLGGVRPPHQPPSEEESVLYRRGLELIEAVEATFDLRGGAGRQQHGDNSKTHQEASNPPARKQQ